MLRKIRNKKSKVKNLWEGLIRLNIIALSCLLVFVCSNCYGGVNLSTPENTYEAYQTFVSEKNYEGFYKCFFLGDTYNKENLTVLADKLFHGVLFEGFKILNKKNISSDRVEITVEEIMVFTTHGGAKTKSKVLIELVRVENEWKIFQTKSLGTNKIE